MDIAKAMDITTARKRQPLLHKTGIETKAAGEYSPAAFVFCCCENMQRLRLKSGYKCFKIKP
jgi:hypothetical protein